MISGRGRQRVASVLVVGALGAMAATAGEAKTSVRPRPDLAVSRGALKLDARRLTGTVVVRNVGRRRAPATSVVILVRFRGSDIPVGYVSVPALDARMSKSVKVSLRWPAFVRLPTTASACADERDLVRERDEGNNCRSLGAVSAPKAASASVAPATASAGDA